MSNRFIQFLKEQGDETIAARVGGKPRGVQEWRLRNKWPRRKTAMRLVEIGQGAFSLEDVYAAKDCRDP